MEIILTQDVKKLGKAGTVVKVKDGFARNFLIPNGLAVLVNESNLKNLEQKKKSELMRKEQSKKQAEEVKLKLAGLSLTIPVLIQAEEKLYGSIGVQEIEKALNDEGFQIDKNAIIIEEPIKSLGIYEVPIKLHPEVTVNIKVWIVKK